MRKAFGAVILAALFGAVAFAGPFIGFRQFVDPGVPAAYPCYSFGWDDTYFGVQASKVFPADFGLDGAWLVDAQGYFPAINISSQVAVQPTLGLGVGVYITNPAMYFSPWYGLAGVRFRIFNGSVSWGLIYGAGWWYIDTILRFELRW